jgi:hypothetical protein
MNDKSAPEKPKKQLDLRHFVVKRKEPPEFLQVSPPEEEKLNPVTKKLKPNERELGIKKQESDGSLIKVELNRKSMKLPESTPNRETTKVGEIEISNSTESNESKTSSDNTESIKSKSSSSSTEPQASSESSQSIEPQNSP